MKFIPVWLICILFVDKSICETIRTNSSNLAKDFIEGTMDLSADPCDDFYQYGCGNWDNFHKEADGKYHDIISLIDYKANKEMAGSFDGISLENQPIYVRRAYEFYKSCKIIDEYKSKHYLTWITEKEKLHVPTIWRSRATRDNFDWLKTLAVLRTYGLNGIFIQETVVQRREDPVRYIIEFDMPTFMALTRDNLQQIINSLDVPIVSINFKKLWSEVQEFELEMKKLEDFKIDLEQPYDRNWPLKQIKDIPLSWLKDYIKILVNQTELNPNMEIHLKKLSYFNALGDFFTQHSKSFICKYLQIRFLWHLHQQGHTHLTAEDCVSYVRSSIPQAMDWLYEKQHPELQQEIPKITELFEDIRKRFIRTIQETHKERTNFLALINNMKLKFYKVPHLYTVQTLEKSYENLDLNMEEFYVNHLKLMKFNFKATHDLLYKPTQQKEFFDLESSNSGVNSAPYLSRTSNTVVVPLSLLQPPIYQTDSDNIYKYSTFGYLLARAMFHGGPGQPLYSGRIICRFDFPKLFQQLADISSVYYAYQMFNDTQSNVMDVDMRKLFFLSFAQNFCSALDSDKFVNLITHGSNPERLTTVLTRFPDFSKVYQCNSSQRMYTNKWCPE